MTQSFAVNWIAGKWVAGLGESFHSLNPFSSEVIWQGQAATADQVEHAVQSAREALLSWRHTSLEERQAIVEK